MIRKIVTTKDNVLRKKAKSVKKIDKKILALIADMVDTLKSQKDPEGVGLAAPQVGKSLAIFVMKTRHTNKVIINPKVLEVSKEKQKKGKNKILEGCLSLPNFYGPIKRARKIKISYLNPEGKKIEEEFTGFDAQIVQHEIDHLNGIIFVDRILEQKAPLYKFTKNDWEEVDI